MAPIIICIDGNIGVGKSTLLNELHKRGYTVIKEDIDTWGWCLNKFYSDPHRWAFTLQMAILNSMISQYRNIQSMGDRLVFIERSPEAGMIFTRNNYHNGNLSLDEYNLIESYYNLFEWYPHIIILLKASVDKCMERIKRRNRECEKSITADYIYHLNVEYDKLQAIDMTEYNNVQQLANDVELICNIL